MVRTIVQTEVRLVGNHVDGWDAALRGEFRPERADGYRATISRPQPARQPLDVLDLEVRRCLDEYATKGWDVEPLLAEWATVVADRQAA